VTSLRERVPDELQRRNYSGNKPAATIMPSQSAEYFHKSAEHLAGDEIRHFELHLLQDKKLAPGAVEGRMSAPLFLDMGFEAAGHCL